MHEIYKKITGNEIFGYSQKNNRLKIFAKALKYKDLCETSLQVRVYNKNMFLLYGKVYLFFFCRVMSLSNLS